MAALGRIEKILNRAENDHHARAQKRKSQNQGNGDNGQDQGIFDEGLPFLAGRKPGKRCEKWFDDGIHLRKLADITLKNYINGMASTTKEISNEEIKPISVSARDLREWNCSNL